MQTEMETKAVVNKPRKQFARYEWHAMFPYPEELSNSLHEQLNIKFHFRLRQRVSSLLINYIREY